MDPHENYEVVLGALRDVVSGRGRENDGEMYAGLVRRLRVLEARLPLAEGAPEVDAAVVSNVLVSARGRYRGRVENGAPRVRVCACAGAGMSGRDGAACGGSWACECRDSAR